MAKPRLPHFLFLGYVVLWLWAAVKPYDRATWWAENIPIMILVGSLTVAYVRGVQLSNLAWVLMAVLPYWHTIGGHYTFERVPFDWFNNLFGFKRNMFDRVGHFSVGFYAFALIEHLESTDQMSGTLACMFGIFTIAFFAMSYELLEWIYAATAGGESGAAFLGSQGDVWDAQKDMLMDTLGAITVTALYLVLPARRTGRDAPFPPGPRGRATVAARRAS